MSTRSDEALPHEKGVTQLHQAAVQLVGACWSLKRAVRRETPSSVPAAEEEVSKALLALRDGMKSYRKGESHVR